MMKDLIRRIYAGFVSWSYVLVALDSRRCCYVDGGW
jgi:hypothetical protein